MEGVDFIYGCHLWTPLEYGKVAAMPGPFMAAADFFKATITGRGGHGGLPHTAIDTIAAAAEFVGSLQHIVSRRADPLQPAVVTIGSFHAGDAPNVIPGRAELRGTTRSFDAALRERMPELIEEIGNGVCAAHGAEFELDFTFGYKPVVNDERATGLVRDVVGDELSELDPIMGGDDFSAYLAEAPGCYAFVGAGGEYPHHHPRFLDRRAGARDRDPAPCPSRPPSARGVRIDGALLGSRRRGGAGRPPAPPRRDPLAGRGAGRRAGARARAAPGADARRVLARRVRLARGRGRARTASSSSCPTACTSSPRATARRCC